MLSSTGNICTHYAFDKNIYNMLFIDLTFFKGFLTIPIRFGKSAIKYILYNN